MIKKIAFIVLAFWITSLNVNAQKEQISDSNVYTDKELKLTKAVGGLSAVTLYNTYLSISMIAQGYETTYDSLTVSQLLAVQISFMNNLSITYNDLIESNALLTDDVVFAQEVLGIFGDMINQANSFNKYVASKSDVDLGEYSNSGDIAWTRISQLLGYE